MKQQIGLPHTTQSSVLGSFFLTVTVLFVSNFVSYAAVRAICAACGCVIKRTLLKIFFTVDCCLSLFVFLAYRVENDDNILRRPELSAHCKDAVLGWYLTKIYIFIIFGYYWFCCKMNCGCDDKQCTGRPNPRLTSVKVFSNNDLHEGDLEASVPVYASSAPPIAPVVGSSPQVSGGPPEYEESFAPPPYSVAMSMTNCE